MDLARFHSERLLHSLSSATEQTHPQFALYRVQPSPQLDLPSAMRRNTGTKDTHYHSVSCVPTAYLDPGVDPASVDFRNFYAYIPNEVKHRKRTTRDQAKVLESIFDRNTKPDSSLRQRLAKELQMSARGVQVWFQNRRAKEKSMGKKAVAAAASSSTVHSLSSSSSPQEKALKGTEDQDEEVSPPGSSSPSSPEMSPAPKAHVPIFTENNNNDNICNSNNNNSSQNVSPEIPPSYAIQHPGPPQASPDLYNTRRGSLPTIIEPQSTMPWSDPGRSPAVNILARRGSAERLGINPYARFLMGRPRIAPYQPRPTSLRESHDQASLLHYNEDTNTRPPNYDLAAAAGRATAPADHFEARSALLGLDASSSSRPMLGHRASMPHVFSGAHLPRRASMPMDELVYPSAFGTSAGRAMPADNHVMYAMSSRTIPSSPIPGPLPCPDFSFGPPADSPLAPSPTPGDNDGSGGVEPTDYTPSLQSYSFGRRADDNDTEDDATEASYDALSRFGSITSVAGSESSNTSAYYSDVGSCNELPAPPSWYSDTRRGSYASSGQFLDLVSGLDLGHGRHESDEGDCSAGDLPSPSSTVSPGNSSGEFTSSTSTQTQTQTQNLPIPISGSSELAHALQTNHDRKGWDGTELKTKGTAQYDIYTRSSAAPVYPQSDSSSSSNSSLSLPIMLERHQKTSYQDNDTGQFDHHQYHAHPTQTQALSTEAHCSTTGSYTPQYGQEILELHHAMEYQNSGYVSGAIDMADVTSVMEHTLQACEMYLQYP